MIFNALSRRWLLNITMWFVIIFFANITTSCATQQREYRAYIDQVPSWQMKETCGFEGCYPMVDVLVGSKMSIRFDFYKIQNNQLIFSLLRFLDTNDDIIINTKNITATINSGNKLPVKTFRCADAVWDLKVLRSMPPIIKPIQIKKNDCLLVFFDYQQFGDQSIAMDMDKAFTTNSRAMAVPTIYFRPNPNYKD